MGTTEYYFISLMNVVIITIAWKYREIRACQVDRLSFKRKLHLPILVRAVVPDAWYVQLFPVALNPAHVHRKMAFCHIRHNTTQWRLNSVYPSFLNSSYLILASSKAHSCLYYHISLQYTNQQQPFSRPESWYLILKLSTVPM